MHNLSVVDLDKTPQNDDDGLLYCLFGFTLHLPMLAIQRNYMLLLKCRCPCYDFHDLTQPALVWLPLH